MDRRTNMKKAFSIMTLILVLVLMFSSCKGEDKSYSSVYEKQQATYIEQLEKASSPATKNLIGTIAFIVGGIAIGGLAGYAIGKLLYYTLLNDFIMSSGFFSILEVFILLFGIAGGFAGYQLSKHLITSKGFDEYINVETSFLFSQPGGEETRTILYGISENEDASKHFLPRFSTNQEVQLTIEMNTSMLNNKIKKVSKYQQSAEILIPVELKILNTDNISYKYDGGIQKDYYTEESNSQNETCYKFFIKNNSELKPNIKFLFSPEDVGDVQIDVLYGTPEYKMVDSSCDIAQTIKFIEE